MIIGGENISSLALESIIVQHPSILECAVVALRDEKWGESPKAFLTIKTSGSESSDSTPQSESSEAEILEWIKQHPGISRFMVPKELEIVKELPKTSTGKVRKNVLREWAKGGERDTTVG